MVGLLFFLGGGGLPRTGRNPLPQLLIVYPKIDKLKSNAMTLRNQFFWFVAETLISFYQNNECLWNYNIPEYHTNSNKDLLLDCLVKELEDKYTKEDIQRKWKSLLKVYRQEHGKVQKKPSGSGTSDVYRSSWEFYAHLQFTNSICDDTEDTIDTISGPSSAKKRKKERHDIENKKLELFEQAIVAIKAPYPATGDAPAPETNEALVFGKYVGLTLSKLAPSTFRRAKKCISDVLFEFEGKDELEKVNSTSFARNSTQRGFSRVDYPSSLASGLSYSDTSYASASNITPPGPFNPYFHVGTHMQSAEQPSRPSLGVESSNRNQAVLPDFD